MIGSGEPVLLVVADVARRRASLESHVAGMAPLGLAVVSWAALGAEPALADPYPQLLVLDPPPVAGALAAAEAGRGYAHLAWGEPECTFALAHWRSQLDLRPALIDVWRALGREGGEVEGDALVRLLRGRGAYPRGGALSGRLLRILCELGLADLDREGRRARSRTGPRTDLARSPAGRAYAARLAEAERHLGAGARLDVSGPATVARAS